jgi:hypothetical protein
LERHVDDRIETGFPNPDEYAWNQVDDWDRDYNERQQTLQEQRELEQQAETQREFEGLLTTAASEVGIRPDIPELQAQFADVLDRAQHSGVLEQAFEAGYSEQEIADAMSYVAAEEYRQDAITRNVLNGPGWNRRR